MDRINEASVCSSSSNELSGPTAMNHSPTRQMLAIASCSPISCSVHRSTAAGVGVGVGSGVEGAFTRGAVQMNAVPPGSWPPTTTRVSLAASAATPAAIEIRRVLCLVHDSPSREVQNVGISSSRYPTAR